MKLWILGANGFVGKALSDKTGALATGREVDIGSLEACRTFVQKRGEITHIVNCAAFSEVDAAEANHKEASYVNALGPENLARVAKENRLKLLHLSTDYVFDGEGRALFKEEDLAAPCNVYGKTKLEGEKRLLAILPEACILRTSWVFGNGGKNFFAQILALLQTKDTLQLVSDQTSRLTYVPDLLEAILALLPLSGIYHFANANPTNKYAFTFAMKEIAEELSLPIRCKNLIPVSASLFPSIAKRPLYSALDTKKIEPFCRVRPWQEALHEHLCELGC